MFLIDYTEDKLISCVRINKLSSTKRKQNLKNERNVYFAYLNMFLYSYPWVFSLTHAYFTMTYHSQFEMYYRLSLFIALRLRILILCNYRIVLYSMVLFS